jgi:hypothetical protein
METATLRSGAVDRIVFGRAIIMSARSRPQDWIIKEQTVTDPVSGLTFEFEVSADGEPHLHLYGDCLVFGNRTLMFHLDGQAATGETSIPGRGETPVGDLSGFIVPRKPR